MLHSERVEAADGKGPKRLMVVLHGLGDSLEGYRWLPEAMGWRWMNYLLVNAPDPYYGGYSWYDYAGDPAPGVRRSRAEVMGVLDRQREEGFASEDTVLFGFSQGSLIALEVASRYPQRLAAVVGVSGYAHEPEALIAERSAVAGEQRILLTHGTRDPLIPLEPVRAQVAGLRAAGLPIVWREFDKAHTLAGEEELEVIRSFVEVAFRGRS